ncbi:hypothetical protein DIPPA_09563 [Diplonema papillatum]|nr:hypothetical protein DIPPA_17447 [Diplonema papillatum]KAJ9455263.1 hypothetical protein DIPPA_09563 [Diplonema papillatum]
MRRSMVALCYRARYDQLRADPTSVLGGKTYSFLQSELHEYVTLLQKYGVKQSEMERVKRLSDVLGYNQVKGKTREKKPVV